MSLNEKIAIESKGTPRDLGDTAQLRLLLDRIHDAVLLKDAAGTYLFCNEAGASILRKTVAEIVGKTDEQLFASNPPLPLEGERRVLRTGEESVEEHTLTTTAGQKNFQIRRVPINIEEGHPDGLLILGREITEQKRAQDAFRLLVLGSSATGEQFFQTMVNTMCSTFEVDYAIVGEISEDNSNQVTSLAVSRSDGGHQNICYQLPGTPCEMVLRESFCHFPDEVHKTFPADTWLAENGIRSYMGISLRSEDGVPLGLISLLSQRPLNDPEVAESMLRVVAARSATELQRQRAERALRRNLHEFSVLNEVGKACSQARTLDELMGTVTRIVAGSLFPDNCGFAILDEARKVLFPHHSFVLTSGSANREPIPLDRGIVGRTARTHMVQRIGDVRTDPDYFGADDRTRSELCTPIVINGRLAGVLNIESSIPHAFGLAEERLIIAIADVVSATWERIIASQGQQQSDNIFRAVVDQAADAIFLHDMSGKFVDVNHNACESTGYSRCELLSQTVFDIAADLPFGPGDHWWDSITPGQYHTREGIHKRKDGTHFPVEIRLGCVQTFEQSLIVALARDISERKLRERKLRLMEFSIERAVDPVFWIAPDSTILYVNEAATKTLRFSRDEMIGRKVWDIDPHFPAEVWPQHWEEIKERGAFKFESDHWTKDGQLLRTEVTVNYLQYEGSEYNCAVMRDISDQTRVAARLQQNEEHLRLAMSAAPLGTWDWNLQSGTIYWSDNLWEMFGLAGDRGTMTFERFIDRVDERDIDRVRERVNHCLQTGEPCRIEFRVIWPDGTIRWTQSHSILLRDEHGQPVRLVGINLDITERIHSEAVIRDSEVRFRTLFESCPDSILLLDTTGKIRAANPAAAKIHGYESQELLTLSVQQLESPDQHKLLPDRLEKLKIGKILRFEVNHLRKNGTIFPVEVVACPLEINGERLILSFERDITERKLAAEALRISEERFSKLFYYSPFSILVATYPDGRVVDANDSFLKLFECDLESIKGQTTEQLLIWEQLSDRRQMLEALKSEKRLKNGEYWFKTAAGNRRLLLLSIEIIEINGQLMSLAMSIDITARRLAQDSLNESLATLRATLDATADGILVVDLQNQIVDFNQQFAELWLNQPTTGSFDTQLVQKGACAQQLFDQIRVQAASAENAVNLSADASTDAEPSTFHVLELKDGRTIEQYSQPQKINGIPAGRVFSFRDVTPRRKAEATLKETLGLLQAISDGTTDALVVKDLQGRYLLCNKAAARFAGRDISSILGKDDTEIFPRESAEIIRGRDLAVIRSGNTETTEEVIRTGEVIRTFLTTKGPYRDHNGKIIGVIGILRDVTESKRLEQRIFESQKMEAVGELAGGVAHDFNNLLTIINGYCDLLLSRLAPDDLSFVWVSEIRDAGRRAAQVTQQLLSFSRKAVIDPKVIDLNAAIGQSERLLRRLIGEHIQLIVTCDPATGPIRVDSGQLDQVLMNLAINARDAMPDGGLLHIATRRVTDQDIRQILGQSVPAGVYSQISVSDSGHGMAPDVLSRIFEPFYTTKEKGKGTGLGLAVVHGIVEQNGGWIHVASSQEHGTAFSLWFPTVSETVAPAAKSAVPSGKRRSVGTILVVEDEAGVRQILRTSLENAGYHIIEACNPDDALSQLDASERRIDLLVTDIVMPGLSGRQLAENLRQKYPALPVLFISGYAGKDHDQQIATSDKDRFIQKPFSPRKLVSVCDELVRRTRTQ